MKNIFILSFLLLSTSTFASIVKSYDAERDCDLYRSIGRDENGNLGKPNANEVLVQSRDTYGMSFRDMEVNFETREVMVQPIMNIVLGFNRPLTETKLAIAEGNKDFTYLINQLNRNVLLFEKVCITRDGKIEYAKMPETKPTPAPTPTPAKINRK